MKADLPRREPNFIKKWTENQIYEKMVWKTPDPEKEYKNKNPPKGKDTLKEKTGQNKMPLESKKIGAVKIQEPENSKNKENPDPLKAGHPPQGKMNPAEKDPSALTGPLPSSEGKPPVFFLLDGPIYSNGELHLGHVLNKILKDIVVKYKNLFGFHAPFIPTWDCHGLPIETAVLKKQKSTERRLPAEQLRAECRKEAEFWVRKQKESFQRLGVLAEWDHPVLTMDPAYEAEEVRALAKITEKGLIFQGRKPVLWCFKLKTALAFSEAEYRSHKSPSVYVRFFLTPESAKGLNISPSASFVIWTTTPWTLPANEAVCLHPDFDYGLYKGKEEKFYITARKLKESFEKETGIQLAECKKTFKGRDLEGLSLRHPFMDRTVPVILGDHVTLTDGTGCVHTAPGHGQEDFLVGKKYALRESCPVDGGGCFTKEAGEDLKGLFIFKGNKIILEKLEAKGCLAGAKEITHSYPYNPRSHSPLIYRLTPQWFLKLDDPKYPIRRRALSACNGSEESEMSAIQFVPPWGKARLQGMLKSSPDWCLSRQRYWGVPLPVFYCENCFSPFLDPRTMERIADEMEKSGQGMEYYFSTETQKLLPEGLKCPSCGQEKFKKGTDIVDVWFDSGVEHTIFRKKGYPFPADLYLEGSDQHRGWFQTSLISSLALNLPPSQKSAEGPVSNNVIPFKTLLTHGFINDREGQKMSKSRGNIMDPFPVIQKKGVEILRLWAVSEDYSRDISAGEEMFHRVTDTYRRFRNTIRFMLGNLNDFTKENSRSFSDLSPADQWALIQLNNLIQECQGFFDNYAFHKIYHIWNRFFTVTLSSFYLDIIKDRLYTFGKNSPERRGAQTVLYHLLDRLLPLMAPVTCFLSEEAYGFFPGRKKESVLLETIPPPHPDWKSPAVEKLFEKLFPLRDQLNKQLEDLREKGVIGSALQAEAVLTVPESFFPREMTSQELCEFFSVSKITVEEGAPGKRNAEGRKTHSAKEKPPATRKIPFSEKSASLKDAKPAATGVKFSESAPSSSKTCHTLGPSIKAFPAQGEKCLRCWFYSMELTPESICPKCVENLPGIPPAC